MQEDIAKMAYNLGVKYESEYGGCCQSTIAAIQDALGIRNDDVFKSCTGFGGGIGLVNKGPCGALVAGALMIGYIFGRTREEFADTQGKRFAVYHLVEQLYNKFVEEYGSAYCCDIQSKVFGGVSRDLRNKERFQEFLADGGHKDKCPIVVGKAAQWAVEIILANTQ